MSKDFKELSACLRHRNVKGKIVQLGVVPNRVDLLTVIEGVMFDDAWSGRVAGHYGAQAVDYRPQDLLDIDSLT